MNHLIRILTSDRGEIYDEDFAKLWHIAIESAGCVETLCGGEVVGFGASGCKYEEKTVKRGGITCEKCIEVLKSIKRVKL